MEVTIKVENEALILDLFKLNLLISYMYFNIHPLYMY